MQKSLTSHWHRLGENSSANINAPADGCGWVKPISVAEEDRQTTATKRALLAHNEAWTEFCK